MNSEQKKFLRITIAIVLSVLIFNIAFGAFLLSWQKKSEKPVEKYWFVLHRKSNKEELFKGIPGDRKKSSLVKTFVVKTGIPGGRPTPLPKLLGKDYWLLVAKEEQKDNPETAPYFLTLNIPAPTDEPYGPTPYTECNGQQCHWILPGAFGLHGIAGNPDRLGKEDPGSSGCIRHKDEDITYLYNLLDPKKEEIRYYVEDN
ncbi:MAG: L,D-transpeptidase [Candidatus Levybacteria bacterium]|nr:L,D-transpeptidase [Candidatus Levybacteria bacterium]